jgi:hypothetical protein
VRLFSKRSLRLTLAGIAFISDYCRLERSVGGSAALARRLCTRDEERTRGQGVDEDGRRRPRRESPASSGSPPARMGSQDVSGEREHLPGMLRLSGWMPATSRSERTGRSTRVRATTTRQNAPDSGCLRHGSRSQSSSSVDCSPLCCSAGYRQSAIAAAGQRLCPSSTPTVIRAGDDHAPVLLQCLA